MKYHWMGWLLMTSLVLACNKPTATPVADGGGQGEPASEAPVTPQIGTVALEIEADDLDGTSFRLSDYRGNVVVLDFWGDW